KVRILFEPYKFYQTFFQKFVFRTLVAPGSRLQRTTNGKFLRKDTESAKMGEPYCRRGIHHHRHILLLDNVFVK
ncbi:hypothetical protein, partial [Prevotella nigrescens]|uniref:hypothetical protein n=1 Tax=Prevotella nigrescens TaxID=28133 RepID=UPI0005683CE7